MTQNRSRTQVDQSSSDRRHRHGHRVEGRTPEQLLVRLPARCLSLRAVQRGAREGRPPARRSPEAGRRSLADVQGAGQADQSRARRQVRASASSGTTGTSTASIRGSICANIVPAPNARRGVPWKLPRRAARSRIESATVAQPEPLGLTTEAQRTREGHDPEKLRVLRALLW